MNTQGHIMNTHHQTLSYIEEEAAVKQDKSSVDYGRRSAQTSTELYKPSTSLQNGTVVSSNLDLFTFSKAYYYYVSSITFNLLDRYRLIHFNSPVTQGMTLPQNETTIFFIMIIEMTRHSLTYTIPSGIQIHTFNPTRNNS